MIFLDWPGSFQEIQHATDFTTTHSHPRFRVIQHFKNAIYKLNNTQLRDRSLFMAGGGGNNPIIFCRKYKHTCVCAHTPTEGVYATQPHLSLWTHDPMLWPRAPLLRGHLWLFFLSCSGHLGLSKKLLWIVHHGSDHNLWIGWGLQDLPISICLMESVSILVKTEESPWSNLCFFSKGGTLLMLISNRCLLLSRSLSKGAYHRP